MRGRRIGLAVGLGIGCLALGAPGRVWAWWPAGHSILSKAAVLALPADVPAFFRAGGGMVAHCAQDPDVLKVREFAALNDHEGPDHYIDWERLEGRALPPTR